jgi:hypothetical protein
MHCEDCQNLLLDLAYGELDDARSAEVHQHLDGCSSCAADWAKISRGRSAAAMLPVASAPTPSRALLEAIEKSLPKSSVEQTGARPVKSADVSGSVKSSTATAGRAEEKQGEAKSSEASGSGATVVPLKGGARWLERLAAMAMRREVAMAAVFLMALGVGVTTLYNPSRNPAITEEDRSRDVIPAVEVSAENQSANERAGQRRAPSADPSLRARAIERTDNLTRGQRPVVAPMSAAAPSTASPSPATRQSIAAGSRQSENVDNVAADNVAANNAVLNAPSQNTASNTAAVPSQRPSQAVPSLQRSMSNAGVEVAGVQQQPLSTMELAARSALSRGEVGAALEQYRQALAAASDDVTRARLQREIASLEAAQEAASAAQNAQHSQAGGVPTSQVQSAESSYRRSRVAPARATNRMRSSTAGSNDNYRVLGY